MKCLKLALCALICLTLVGCATTGRNADTTSASTEWRIKSLEESFLNFREQQRKMADESSENAERLERRLAAVEAGLAALRGNGGAPMAPQAAVSDDAPANENWVNDLKPEDEGWVEGGKPTEQPMNEPMVQNDAEKPWANLPEPPAVIPEPEVIERAITPAPMSVAVSMTPKGLYDKGYAQYNADSMEQARATFDQFLSKYPEDGLVPNALYWKGETYYSDKNYPQAILTFKEVTTRFPKHDKAASALLKIGMAYDRVGDRDNAVFYLRALIEDFPGSDQAGLARKELARLGG